MSNQNPFQPTAEQAILGSALLDESCIPTIVEALKPEDFQLPLNRAVFGAICSLFRSSQPIDPVTVLEKAKQAGTLDTKALYDHIQQLLLTTPTAAHVGAYIEALRSSTGSGANG